jgi:hypothetical protein
MEQQAPLEALMTFRSSLVFAFGVALAACGTDLPSPTDGPPADLSTPGCAPGSSCDASLIGRDFAVADAAVADLAVSMADLAISTPDGGYSCSPPCGAQQYCYLTNLGDAGFLPGQCITFSNGCADCTCLQQQHQCLSNCFVQNGQIYFVCE